MSINYNQLDQYQKYMIAVANKFNKICVPRYDNNGNLVKYIIVPIIFSQNDKLYDIANSNTYINPINNNTIETNYPVPSMSIEIMGLEIDHNRKISEINNIGENDEAFSPLPIILDMTLSIETKKLADMLKIFEQILPLFPNKQCSFVNVYNSFNDEIKIVLENVTTNFPSEFERNVQDYWLAEYEFKVYAKSFKIPKQPITSAEYEFVLKSVDSNLKIEDIYQEG